MKTRHLLSIADLSKGEIIKLLKLAAAVKKHPKEYHRALYEKVLLTFFQMPSLRT
ncbi:MAG TPA: ornithine carbamoyltransferase, partial [Candidatus Nanoarchaeia archaeon]|nr:ornithine carbamoyltransferase [Candidatus Nanoarchaeia archaeon]